MSVVLPDCLEARPRRTGDLRCEAVQVGTNERTDSGPCSWPGFVAKRGRSLSLLVIVATAAVMLWWTWKTWPDSLVDFGMQLYTPWQLTSGKTLYTDVAYFKGPLSPYLNALWFKVFGVSLRALVAGNLLVLAGLVALLYRLLLSLADRLSATVACLVFLLIFAFGQSVGIGNYNFVCPYSHEVTHGIVLSLAALFCLGQYQRSGRTGWIGGAGAALGLTFLTDAQVFVAAALAAAMWFGFAWRAETLGRTIRLLGVFAAAAIAPVVLAGLLLTLAMPLNQAWEGILGSWPSLLHGDAANLRFYRYGMGLDEPSTNLKRMLLWTGWYALVFLPAGAVSFAAGKRKAKLEHPAWAVAVFGIVAAGLMLTLARIDWLPNLARPFPALLLALIVANVIGSVRRSGGAAAIKDNQLVLRASLTVFALMLLSKMFLNARLYHYGFALAMPATLLLVATGLRQLPRAVEARGGHAASVRATVLALALVTVVGHLRFARSWFQTKRYVVGTGGDAFRADARGDMLAVLLDQLRVQAKPNETLAVLPEGAMVNYLARRQNPTPYVTLMPTELAIFGEQRVLAAYQAHPPDWIAMVHVDTSEHGYRYFGADYGRAIGSWIEQSYRPLFVINHPLLREEGFEIRLWEHVSDR